MAGLETLEEKVGDLSVKVAELRPIVKDIHAGMPRMLRALETLAHVTERLESNSEDHKRIHYRITDNEKQVDEVKAQIAAVKEDLGQLKEEHIQCQAEREAEAKVGKSNTPPCEGKNSFLSKLRRKVEENVATILALLVVAFAFYLFVPPLLDFIAKMPAIINNKIGAEVIGEVE